MSLGLSASLAERDRDVKEQLNCVQAPDTADQICIEKAVSRVVILNDVSPSVTCGPSPHNSTSTPMLLLLPEELMVRILFMCDEISVCRAAQVCKFIRTCSLSQQLWRHLCIARWPRLERSWRAVAGYEYPKQGNGGCTWRSLYQSRARMPYWRDICVLLDETLDAVLLRTPSSQTTDTSMGGAAVHVVGQAPSAASDGQSGSAIVFSSSNPNDRFDFGWAIRLCTDLVRLLSARARDGRHINDTSYTEEFSGWRREIRRALAQPSPHRSYTSRLAELCAWASASARCLDVWYDYAMLATSLDADSAETVRRLQALLRRANEARTALQVICFETYLLEPEPTAASMPMDEAERFMTLWEEVNAQGTMEEIESSIRSLQLEGFNVATPVAQRPRGMPDSHWWWYCRPPFRSNVC